MLRAFVWAICGGIIGMILMIIQGVDDPGPASAIGYLLLPGAFFGFLFGISRPAVGIGAASGGIGGWIIAALLGVPALGFLAGVVLGAFIGGVVDAVRRVPKKK